MNHLSEEELILRYYGEEDAAPAAGRHLDGCAECRALYASLQRVLNVVDALSVPEVAPDYGARLWQRLERRVPVRRRWWRAAASWRRVAAGAAFAGLLMAAFLAGRFFRRPPEPAIAKAELEQNPIILYRPDNRRI